MSARPGAEHAETHLLLAQSGARSRFEEDDVQRRKKNRPVILRREEALIMLPTTTATIAPTPDSTRTPAIGMASMSGPAWTSLYISAPLRPRVASIVCGASVPVWFYWEIVHVAYARDEMQSAPAALNAARPSLNHNGSCSMDSLMPRLRAVASVGPRWARGLT
jgi:hypothetical protein